MTEQEKAIWDNACAQLVKIADMMERCEPGSSEYKMLAKDYRAYAKILYPKAKFSAKPKKKTMIN